jgi:uncharacterized membrane protein
LSRRRATRGAVISDQPSARGTDEGKTATIIYILYLVGLVVGVTYLIGVIMAYVNRDSGPEWVRSHYRFQIRTFWMGVLYAVIGVVTLFIVVGIFVLLFYYVWLIVRCVKGLKLVNNSAAYPNLTTWLW